MAQKALDDLDSTKKAARKLAAEKREKAAITAPRWLLGKTWGDDTTSLKIEENADAALINALRAAGHQVELTPAFSSLMGHAGAVLAHPDGHFEAATDPRSDGMAYAL